MKRYAQVHMGFVLGAFLMAALTLSVGTLASMMEVEMLYAAGFVSLTYTFTSFICSGYFMLRGMNPGVFAALFGGLVATYLGTGLLLLVPVFS